MKTSALQVFPKHPHSSIVSVMEIVIDDRQRDLAIDPLQVQHVVEAVLGLHDCSCDGVTIHFVGEEEICRLHDEFFSDPSVTDCISLPMDSERVGGSWILGEVFVCPSVACRYSEERDRDRYEETCLYIVHGLLHLLGHDDIDEGDRAVMRGEESRCMRHLDTIGAILSAPRQI